MKTLLICDCDGVLVDSEALACRVDADEFQSRGFANLTFDEVVRRFTGVSQPDMIAIIEKETGRTVGADFGDVVSHRLEELMRKSLQPLPDVAETLATLQMAKCVASSSAPPKLELALSVTKLDQFFGHNVFSAVSVKNGKPAPDLFLYAASRMDFPPNACCVIEDSVAGVTAAVRAGMTVIGFVGGSHCANGHDKTLLEHGARLVLRRWGELPNALMAFT
ncbi:MAG: HAD family phosphatase [Hyphomicrobiales bacterium]|nr:HAD family phosphatase [Hyphomicrobiales bacterium]